MKNIGVYAGTFDPITLGHVDLIDRATRVVDEVIVAIAASEKKQPLFNLEERVQLAQAVLKPFKQVRVMGFDCLLLDLMQKQQANIILRGLRTVTDFDYEFQLASMNRHLNSAIETIFLMPAERYMYVSASLVREIAALRGPITDFVAPVVAEALYQKFNVKQ